ncbi:MAG: hypothetical protein AAB912_02590 [Patescibacteria group bacterium]
MTILLIVFGGIFYIAVKLAMRDAENGVDFAFKVFGASAGLIFSVFGPVGLIGLSAFFGRSRPEGHSMGVRLAFGALVSIALTIYVLNRLRAFSLFF